MRKLRLFPFVLTLIFLSHLAFSAQAVNSTPDAPKAKLLQLSASQFEV